MEGLLQSYRTAVQIMQNDFLLQPQRTKGILPFVEIVRAPVAAKTKQQEQLPANSTGAGSHLTQFDVRGTVLACLEVVVGRTSEGVFDEPLMDWLGLAFQCRIPEPIKHDIRNPSPTDTHIRLPVASRNGRLSCR
jgi:hypothetical protein